MTRPLSLGLLCLLLVVACTQPPSADPTTDDRDGQGVATEPSAIEDLTADAEIDDGADAGEGPTADETPTDEPDPDPGGVSYHVPDPGSLLTAEATGPGAEAVLAALYRNLIEHDPVTTEPIPTVAAAIETEDSQTFIITIADGWSFHDGEPITARTFVNTFNFVTDPLGGFVGAALFADVLGADAAGRHDGGGLAGVAALDDMTVSITLQRPLSTWPLRLGQRAFSPLPSACLLDPGRCQDSPIGNGPYRMDGPRDAGASIEVVRAEDHAGPPGVADVIEFRVLPDAATAIAQVQDGTLDVATALLPAQVAELVTADPQAADPQAADPQAADPQAAEEQTTDPQAAEERAADAQTADPQAAEEQTADPQAIDPQVVQRPAGTLTFLGLPLYDPRYGGPANLPLRQALSLAIDRQGLTEDLPHLLPAESMVPPIVPGPPAGPCEICAHDPLRALELWTQHGGLPELTLLYNPGAGQEQWVRKIAQDWRTTFGLPPSAVRIEAVDFAALRPEVLDPRLATGPFRLAWAMTHPSPADILPAIHGAGSALNFSSYSDNEFEGLVAQADAAVPLDTGLELYRQAEQVVLTDVPAIPLFTSTATVVHSDRVGEVVIDALGVVRPELLTPPPAP